MGDDVFHIYQRLYRYEPFDLDAKVVAVDASKPNWRMETVSFRAAYGNERVTAYLFLPNNAKPPFQTVVFFPSGTDFGLESSQTLDLKFIEFLIRSGRALLYPVYQSTLNVKLEGVGRSTVYRV